ncbi:3361_t:CDS:10 [Ambispora gerdemannii]|uniref:3361_t:CDS:1 n=1 Tax=Ambispora gerdemannii TaxID=144530 RepID=A0A9N9B2T4_9GLOM|nr:3361_t:CDS:10 [Ambispora gerdemannii]
MSSYPLRNVSSHVGAIAGPSSGAKRRNVPESPPIIQQIRKRRPAINDRTLPTQIEGLVPESRLYTELQNFEKRLDATIMRKRLENQEAIATKHMKSKRILRVFVSNTATNQNIQDEEEPELDFQAGSIPSWTLRIEGRLLDPPYSAARGRTAKKFSTFFKSIIVELDRNPDLYPEGNTMEWTRNTSTQECDGFEIKRKGDQNIKAKILLTLENRPERYKLTPAFASLLDIREETKSGIIRAMWQYVKINKLQDPDNQRIINCDKHLEAIFNKDRIAFPELPELLNPLLDPVDPIEIEYTIRVDKSFHTSRFAYDVEVEVDDILRQRMINAIENTNHHREIQELDEKIMQCVQSINNSKTKRDFMMKFARSPAEFIQKWIASQSRDLEIILGETRANLEEQRQADFFKQPWTHDAAFHYMASMTQRKMHELLGRGASGNNAGGN